MAREFNIKLKDVEMTEGSDSLLENTQVTTVTLEGNNHLLSLDSIFRNCEALSSIIGTLDLNGITDIDNMLNGTEKILSITLLNINNPLLSAINSFPYIEELNIGGNLYDKDALQNVLGSREWTFDNIKYFDNVKKAIFTNSINISSANPIIIYDTLEQKATNFEISGKTIGDISVGELIEDEKYSINIATTYKKEIISEKEAEINDIEKGSYLTIDKLQGKTIANLSHEDKYVVEEITSKDRFILEEDGKIELSAIEGETKYFKKVEGEYFDEYIEGGILVNAIDGDGEYIGMFYIHNAWMKLGKAGRL